MAHLALLGNTGTGKDTFVRTIQKRRPALSLNLIRLADPLYQAQHEIYKICKREKEFFSQDGVLLNFLGQHMRRINPNVIRESFLSRLQPAPQADLTICPDVRPIDLAFIKQAGFFVLQITADPLVAQERRKKRGDLSLGSSSDPMEPPAHLFPEADAHIANDATLEEYEQRIAELLKNRFGIIL